MSLSQTILARSISQTITPIDEAIESARCPEVRAVDLGFGLSHGSFPRGDSCRIPKGAAKVLTVRFNSTP